MRLTLGALALLAFGLLAVTSAHAAITYTAVLSGANEPSPNASPATGHADVTLDTVAHTLSVDVTFDGLLGTSTASHIHAPTALPLTGPAGVATETPTFASFPLGVSSGTYSHVFDTTLTSTWNASYISANGGTPAGAEAALAAALQAQKAYLNVHSTVFPGGEISGFLVVPEPCTISLLGIGAVGLLARTRRERR